MKILESAWQVVARPTALAILVGGLLAAWFAAPRLSRKFHCGRIAAGALPVSLVVILALTLPGDGREPVTGGAGAVADFASQLADFDRIVRYVSQLAAGGNEQLANIALFIPLGFLGYWTTRRAGLVICLCVLLSIVIEAWQSYAGRSGTLSDVINNSFGGVVGTLAGLAARSLMIWTTSRKAGPVRPLS